MDHIAWDTYQSCPPSGCVSLARVEEPGGLLYRMPQPQVSSGDAQIVTAVLRCLNLKEIVVKRGRARTSGGMT